LESSILLFKRYILFSDTLKRRALYENDYSKQLIFHPSPLTAVYLCLLYVNTKK
jgi:hypothetical protein